MGGWDDDRKLGGEYVLLIVSDGRYCRLDVALSGLLSFPLVNDVS